MSNKQVNRHQLLPGKDLQDLKQFYLGQVRITLGRTRTSCPFSLPQAPDYSLGKPACQLVCRVHLIHSSAEVGVRTTMV